MLSDLLGKPSGNRLAPPFHNSVPKCKCQQYEVALKTLLDARRIKGTPEYEAMKKKGWEMAEAAVKDADNT